jgi:hypothetical protein
MDFAGDGASISTVKTPPSDRQPSIANIHHLGPLGAITIAVLAIFFGPRKKTKADTLTMRQEMVALNWVGAANHLPGVICLLLVLQWGRGQVGGKAFLG